MKTPAKFNLALLALLVFTGALVLADGAAKTPAKVEVSTLDAAGNVIDSTPLVPITKPFDAVRVGVVYEDGTADYTYVKASVFPALLPPAVELPQAPVPDPVPTTNPVPGPGPVPDTGPTTKPIPPPVDPLPAIDGYPEGGNGDPSPIPAGIKQVAAGTDISSLSGAVGLKAGNYKYSGKLPAGLTLYSVDGIHAARVALSNGQQVQGGSNDKLFGVAFQGGGTGDPHTNFAAVVTSDGWYLEDVLVEKSTGTGISITGTGVKSVRLIAQDNAASGRGFKSKGYQEFDAVTRRNNFGLLPDIKPDGDGANKGTNTSGSRIHNLWSYENNGRGIWFDGKNEDNQIIGGCFHHNRTWKSDWSYGCGAMNEYTIDRGGKGGFVVDGALFYGNDGIGISVAEAQNVEIKNCTFRLGNPKSNYSKWGIGFRNIKRGPKGAEVTNIVQNVSIHDNRFEDGTGIYSNGGVSAAGSKITIGANEWTGGKANVNLK